MADRSLLSAPPDQSDVAESQHWCAKSNSISQLIYARLDVAAQHRRYQRYQLVSILRLT